MAARVCWVVCGLLVATSAVVVVAGDWNFLGSPACCGPSLGMASLQPGCCENPPSCCRGVWEGYCEGKRAGRWCPRPLAGPLSLGCRSCLRGSQIIRQDCDSSLSPTPDPAAAPSSQQIREVFSPPAQVRIESVNESRGKLQARSSEFVIPLPPVLPDEKE
ncbi:MAG: hypothetical protein ACUVQG_05845 [Thermogutta sp.]